MPEIERVDDAVKAGSSRKKDWPRRIIHLIGIVLVIGMVTIGFVIWAGYSSLDAEKNLQATLFVIRLVDKFVEENQRWPVSWHDLATTMPDNHDQTEQVRLMFGDWPISMEEIRQRIVIDFQPDLRLIAHQDVRTFDTIKPIGRHYPYRDNGWIQQLQKRVQVRILDVKDKNR